MRIQAPVAQLDRGLRIRGSGVRILPGAPLLFFCYTSSYWFI